MSRLSTLAGRAVATTLVLGAAGCSTQKPTPAPAPRPANGGTVVTAPGAPTPGGPGLPGGIPGAPSIVTAGAPGEPNPRPFATVITPQAVTKKGLFTTHVQRGRLYFEIPRGELGRDLLTVVSLKGSPDGIGIRGTLGGSQLVRFERKENRIVVRAVNFRNTSTDPQNPIGRAMPLIQYLPIIASFNVEAYAPDSAPVIDVTRMFTGGVQELAALGRRAAVDPTRSFIERVASYPGNVEIDASQTFTAAPAPAFPGLPTPPVNPAAQQNATTELYHFSLVKLPETPMMARLHDERVIWFTSRQSDFGSREQKVDTRTYINRWRLEKKDASLAVSEPVKPITYYIDPATPAWLVPWVRKGIEEWQPAFEKAGFRNGIVAREVPKDSVDLIHGEDANVSMVRWLPSPVENAVGPSYVDPAAHLVLHAGRPPRPARAPAAVPRFADGSARAVRRRARGRPHARLPAQHEGELDVPARLHPQSVVREAHGPQPEHHGLRALQLRGPARGRDRGRGPRAARRHLRHVRGAVGLHADPLGAHARAGAGGARLARAAAGEDALVPQRRGWRHRRPRPWRGERGGG